MDSNFSQCCLYYLSLIFCHHYLNCHCCYHYVPNPHHYVPNPHFHLHLYTLKLFDYLTALNAFWQCGWIGRVAGFKWWLFFGVLLVCSSTHLKSMTHDLTTFSNWMSPLRFDSKNSSGTTHPPTSAIYLDSVESFSYN